MRRAAKLDRYYDFHMDRQDFDDLVGNTHVVERAWVVTLRCRDRQETNINNASKYLRVAFEGCILTAEKRVRSRAGRISA